MSAARRNQLDIRWVRTRATERERHARFCSCNRPLDPVQRCLDKGREQTRRAKAELTGVDALRAASRSDLYASMALTNVENREETSSMGQRFLCMTVTHLMARAWMISSTFIDGVVRMCIARALDSLNKCVQICVCVCDSYHINLVASTCAHSYPSTPVDVIIVVNCEHQSD